MSQHQAVGNLQSSLASLEEKVKDVYPAWVKCSEEVQNGIGCVGKGKDAGPEVSDEKDDGIEGEEVGIVTEKGEASWKLGSVRSRMAQSSSDGYLVSKS